MRSGQNSWSKLKTAYDDLRQGILWSFWCLLQKMKIGALPAKQWWVFTQTEVDPDEDYTEPGINLIISASDEQEAWEKLRSVTGSDNPCTLTRWISQRRMSTEEVVEMISAYNDADGSWYTDTGIHMFRFVR